MRREAFLPENNAITTECDYAKALKEEFDTEIKSEAFGFNLNLSIEVINYEYHDKYHNGVSKEGNTKMDFHSNFSLESTNNEATTFEHMKNIIH